MRTRVAVVDDDDISRRGLTELLADRPEIEIVGSLTHSDAMSWDTEWSHVDVLLVDAADERDRDDQFPGVALVDRVRRRRSKDETLVIVLTGHFFDDALRRRMSEAKADFFYYRSDLQTASSLYGAVLDPDGARAGVPDASDPEKVFRYGVTPASRVNDAVAHSQNDGLRSLLSERAGSRSRIWLARRRRFNITAHLHPVNADGTLPERDPDAPSLPQIERFLDWATKVKGDGRDERGTPGGS